MVLEYEKINKHEEAPPKREATADLRDDLGTYQM